MSNQLTQRLEGDPASSRAVTRESFEHDVLASDVPVVVGFWAPWCRPCHAVAPVLERIASERRGTLDLVKVNIDEEPELAARFGVSSIPTIVLFEDGEPGAGAVGARNKAQLEGALGLPALSGASEASQSAGVRGLISRITGDRP